VTQDEIFWWGFLFGAIAVCALVLVVAVIVAMIDIKPVNPWVPPPYTQPPGPDLKTD